ncbi:MAG: oligosaccharide flippase family protein [Pseudohongiellaceae bacterium]
MAGRGLGFLAAFVIPMILARLFTVEEFGTYKQLFLIYGTLFGIAQVGMAESLFYFLPNERQHGGKYVANTLLVLGGVGLLAFGGLWVLEGYIARLLNNPDLVGYIPFIGAYLFFMLMAVSLETVMIVKKQHMAASFTYALSDLVRALLYIAPVLIFPELHWLLLGALGFAVIRCVANLIYVAREFGGGLRQDTPLLRKHLGYALPFGLAGLIEILQANFHLYVVSYNFDVATFAIYAVGCLQIPLVEYLTSSTANVMMTSMREKLLAQDKAGACAIWRDTTRKLALIVFPLIAAMIILAHALIILFFTATYEESVPIFMLWSFGMLASVLLTSGALRVLAETRFLIIQNLIQLSLTAIFIFWFINLFGIIGAVLAMILAKVLTRIVSLFRIKAVLDVGWSMLLPWKSLYLSLLLATLAVVPALFVESLLSLPGLPGIAVTGLVYGLSYFCLLLLFGPMYDDEKEMLVDWVQKPFAWVYRTMRLQRG